MRKILLKIEYDGSGFFGWQTQKDSPTVQQTLELALAKLLGHKVTLHGSGRTDAGVHALGQAAHFDTHNMSIPEDKLPFAINALLPSSVAVQSAVCVPEDFHARFDAVSKTYCYKIYAGVQPSPMRERYSARVIFLPDVQLMRQAAQCLLGTHDFSAFRASGSSVKGSVRTLTQADIEQTSPTDIELTFSANGFLYNMVRILTGTLVYVGLGKIPADALPNILKSGDRTLAGKTFPPHGLYLKEVNYNLSET